MNARATHIIDIVLSDDKIEENEELVVAEEIVGIGHAMNTFSCVFTSKMKIVEEPPLNEAQSQKKNNQYKLRSQGIFYEHELTRKKLKENLLSKITSSINPAFNTQNKFVNATTSTNTSTNNKIKSTILEVSDKFNPPDTLAMSTTYETLDYNVVEDMNKSQTNISIFELTRIACQRELLF